MLAPWTDLHGWVRDLRVLRFAPMKRQSFQCALVSCRGFLRARTVLGVVLASAVSVTALMASELTFTGPARLVHPKLVSTAASEIKIAFNPDGTIMLWGAIGREGGPGGLDLFESRRTGDAWSATQPVTFNSAQNDFDPFFAPDGRGVYFFSNRPGGLGGDDVYFVVFDPTTGRYGEPVNLGASINSAGDEWAPVTSPDGSQLLFASDGRGGAGQHDLFVSRREKGAWQKAEPLPGAVNSPLEDFDAAMLDGATTLVFTRRTKDQEGADLFVSFEVGGLWSEPSRLGPEVNAAGAWNLGPAVNPAAPGVLYFSSHRPDASEGRTDIYSVPYRVVSGQAVKVSPKR